MIDKKHGLGYSAGAIEDFHDEVRGVVDAIARGTMSVDMLETDINYPNLSNSFVFFCRLLCSCHIQTRSLQYAPFLGIDVEGEGARGERVVRAKVREYCLREVEPLEKEVGLQPLTFAIFSFLSTHSTVTPITHHPSAHSLSLPLLFHPSFPRFSSLILSYFPSFLQVCVCLYLISLPFFPSPNPGGRARGYSPRGGSRHRGAYPGKISPLPGKENIGSRPQM